MGMSGSFEVAIEEGASLVRIGRALFAEPEERAPLLHIEEVPWDNDDEYRLALFHGKVLLSRQTHVCRRGGDLIAHIRIPEGGEGEEG